MISSCSGVAMAELMAVLHMTYGRYVVSITLTHGVAGREGGDEGLLRDLDPSHHLHPLLALLLLLEQLALAADVAAVALGEDVLAQRADVLAGDDARAD